MKRFISDFKKYYNYMIYATKATLREEVINSHLGALWWILDPLCFMLIYTFISVVVFRSSEPYFPVFVFIGLTAWNFFNKTVAQSTRLIRKNKDTVTKVYLPKWVLLLVICLVDFFKMLISFCLVGIAMAIYQVPLSWYALYVLPLVVVLFLLTFGISSLCLHFGVFVEDLANLMTIFLKFTFYLSGIFYLVSKRVPPPYNAWLLRLNPMAMLIESFRNALLYQKLPHLTLMAVWFVIGLGLCILGIRTIYKYENSYVKVIK